MMDEQNRDATSMEEVSFRMWMDIVNNIIESKVFLSCDDLPDVDYYSMYDSGSSPTEAAEYSIRYAQGKE